MMELFDKQFQLLEALSNVQEDFRIDWCYDENYRLLLSHFGIGKTSAHSE